MPAGTFVYRSATWFCILFSLVTSTIQVDIRMVMSTSYAITCSGLPPGYCCLIPVGLHHSFPAFFPLAVSIGPLHVRDLGVVFEARGNLGGCATLPPVKRFTGPGTFIVRNDPVPPRTEPYRFTGASYVTLPNAVPADITTSELLAAQGLLGLATGGATWSAPNTKWKQFPGPRDKSRRDIIRGHKGNAYAGPPPQSRYPDIITINGTDYHSTNTSALNYQSADGQPLDTADLGF